MVKKIFLFLAILLHSGCAKQFYINQVLENGALACEGDTCDAIMTKSCNLYNYNYNCRSYNRQPLLVFIDKIEGIEYYDGLIFEVPSNLEVVRNGVYKYTSVNNTQKTIPHLIFVDKKNKTKITK